MAQAQTHQKAPAAPKAGKKARQVAAGTMEGKKADKKPDTVEPETEEFHERREGDRRANELATGDRVMEMLAKSKEPELCEEQKRLLAFQAEVGKLAEQYGIAPQALKVKGVKAQRADRLQQNGVTRPAADTTCGKIWALADAISLQTHTVATIAAIRAHESMRTVNDHTIKTQYARWRQFNNISGRLQKIHVVQQQQGEYAGLAPMVTPPAVE